MALLKCPECGGNVSSYADVCPACGCPKSMFNIPAEPQQEAVKIVKAQCTSCNAALEVNNELQSAVCPYCNATYVVSQAINKYNMSIANAQMNINNANINVSMESPTVANYVKRAWDFHRNGNQPMALQYFEKALDIDMADTNAVRGKKYVLEFWNSPSFYSSKASMGFMLRNNMIYLTKRGLLYQQKKAQFLYAYNKIRNLRCSESCVRFEYDERTVSFEVEGVGLVWRQKILEAQQRIFKPNIPQNQIY